MRGRLTRLPSSRTSPIIDPLPINFILTVVTTSHIPQGILFVGAAAFGDLAGAEAQNGVSRRPNILFWHRRRCRMASFRGLWLQMGLDTGFRQRGRTGCTVRELLHSECQIGPFAGVAAHGTLLVAAGRGRKSHLPFSGKYQGFHRGARRGPVTTWPLPERAGRRATPE